MAVPNKVFELVKRFRDNESVYRSPDYQEAHIRQDFIDPFFAELGWDLRNEQNASALYKEVIFEDAIKVGGSTKAPDYCVRVGGKRKFFVEAKKLSVSLADSISAAFQVRRYGWSAKLPVSILTDFEEFAVYDCRVLPNKQDKSTTARSLYLSYTDYASRWNEIYDLFSKEAVLAGSLEQFANGHKQRKGATTVDAAFLKEIEAWRERLAIALSSSNPDLSSRDLNFAVQMTINRLIFLRICEDRGIEPYKQLRSLTEKGQVYEQLTRLFQQAEDRYNSGLFHFKPEKDRPDVDEFTLTLTIPDAPLQQIIQNFYYPDSPYEFSVIPIEILGQVYEQFLGKVIRLTSTQEVVIEDKPEVRKAGGVYYTPTYIVDYIVENTIGRSLAGKTLKQAEKIRVLDPACGSGSFLIGAYQFLLNWYVQQYSENPTQYKKQLYQGSGGDWWLTSAEKKRILLNHIHGVDIDLQAVETTKLSLLLKVLEGESQETLFKQLSLLQERALPDLEQNIKCGNSLIGPDYYDNVQISVLDEEERYRINVFDWKEEFPEIMKTGGFDVVIGNPPYIRIQALKEWTAIEVEIYKQKYTTASKGNYDIYVVFVEKGIELLNQKGSLGFILPHKFFTAQYGRSLRTLISEEKHLQHIVHFGEQQVFTGAMTYTCLMFLNKAGNDEAVISKVDDLVSWRISKKATKSKIISTAIPESEWSFSGKENSEILSKIGNAHTKLGSVAHIFVGTQTSADDVYVLDECSLDGQYITGKSKSLGKVVRVEAECVKPFLRGKQIRKYEPPKTSSYLICPYNISTHECILLSKIEMLDKFPLEMNYLEANREKLALREKGKFQGQNWYAFGYSKSMILFQKPKIIVPDYNNIASFTLDQEGYFYKTGYGVILTENFTSHFYILGLLNSKLLFQYLLSTGTFLRGGYVRFWKQYLQQIPIKLIDFSIPNETAKHDRIVQLVKQMLALHKQLAEAKTPPQKGMIQKKINASDRQIDQLVYELYELTATEIAIVEGM